MRDDSDTRTRKKNRGQGIGKRLKKARKAHGLTIEGAAQNLHLDASVLRALENEQFDVLGAPVFAKGHLRKYGSLLDLPVDDLLLDYYTKHEPDEQPLKVTDFIQSAQTEKKGQWFTIAFAITALVALAVLVAWLYRKTDVSEPATRTVSPAAAPVAVPVTTPEAEPDAADPDTAAAGEPVTAGSMALALPPDEDTTVLEQDVDSLPGQVLAATQLDDEQVIPDEVIGDQVDDLSQPGDNRLPVADIEPALPPVSVVFEFGEDSWVEVYDGNRQRLLYDLGRATTRRSINAAPPVQVFLGNASGVVLTVDGQPYEIQARDIRGETARFTLGTP